jgi:hypothetical protein
MRKRERRRDLRGLGISSAPAAVSILCQEEVIEIQI